MFKKSNFLKKLSLVNALMITIWMSFGSLLFFPAEVTRAKSNLCAQPVDVALVLDRSGSMDYSSRCDWWQLKCVNPPSCSSGYAWVKNTTYNQTSAWCTAKNQAAPHQSAFLAINPKKIIAAKISADNFLALMGPNDQSALVSYANTATLDKTLSAAHTDTQNAVNALVASGATDIGDAIKLGNAELSSGRANPQAIKAMILLTDGLANKPSGPGYGEYAPDVAYAENQAVQAAALGIKIFTIGLGDNGEINETMLGNIASTTGGQYFHSPAQNDLEAIYNSIAWRLCRYGSIAGCKYSDTDKDGDLTGEETIPGWEIKLNHEENKIQLTDENGCYLFSGLLPGSYTVSELGKPGVTYEPTYPSGGFYDLDLAEGVNLVDKDFGNYLPVCGNIFVDTNYGEVCEIGQSQNCLAAYGYKGSQICKSDCSGWEECIPTEYCGDLIINDSEECDTNEPKTCVTAEGYKGEETCTGCRWGSCETREYCGDKIINGQEECDDGNSVTGDGCDLNCRKELFATVKAYKVVCRNESKLPNWGDGTSGPAVITPEVINNFVNQSQGACWLADGWQFEYSLNPALIPGGNHYGPAPAGSGWSAFNTPTASGNPAEVLVYNSDGADINVREILKNDYFMFSGSLTNNVSAEMYCHDDIYIYDNHDIIGAARNGSTYYCAAFNALINPEPYCGDGIINGSEQCDGAAGVGEHQICSSECTLENVPYCGDGIKNGDEQCDDGNTDDYDTCKNNCSLCKSSIDIMMVLDRSGSMGYTSRCDWWQLKCVNPPTCSSGYNWVQNTTYNQTSAWCAVKNQAAPRQSVWTDYGESKIIKAKEAANGFLDLLLAEDQSGLVSYANSAALDKTLSNNHAATKTAVNSLATNGATDIGDAIALANSELLSVRANPLAVKAMILLTDGMANKPYGPGYGEYAPDVDYALSKAGEAAAAGIKIFTIGLGADVDGVMLNQIAVLTGGSYHFAPTAADLTAIFNQISIETCQNPGITINHEPNGSRLSALIEPYFKVEDVKKYWRL